MANKQDPRSARKKIKDAAKDLHRSGGNGLQAYAKSILS